MGKYHDLYVRSDVLLLADVFTNFRKMCVEICKLDPAKYIVAPRLVWQASLKKKEVELVWLNDVDMLLMVEKGIRGRIWDAIHRYAKTNNKYMKDYDKKKKNHPSLIIGM